MSGYHSIRLKSVLITSAVALGLALTPSAAPAATDPTPDCGGNFEKHCLPSKAKRLVNKFRTQPSGTKMAKGRYWSCPSGWKKVVQRQWDSDKACGQKTTKRTKAKNHGPAENAQPPGSFYNLKTKAYWSCPGGYLRKPGAKIDSAKACIPKLGNKCDAEHLADEDICVARKNPGFVKWAKNKTKKLRKQYIPLFKKAAELLKKINTKQNRQKYKSLKSNEAKLHAFNYELISEFLAWEQAWYKEQRKKTSRDVRLASASSGDPVLWALHVPDSNKEKSDLKWTARSFGWVLDASVVAGFSSNPHMNAWDASEDVNERKLRLIKSPNRVETTKYKGRAFSLGVSLGADTSPEIGWWRDDHACLAGKSQAFTIGAGFGLSMAVTWHYSHGHYIGGPKKKKEDRAKLIGFTVTGPSIGGGVELEYNWGRTTRRGKKAGDKKIPAGCG